MSLENTPKPSGTAQASEAQRLDTGLACLVMVARFLDLPVDAAQIHHEMGLGAEMCALDDLIRAGRIAGLKAKKSRSRFDRLDRVTLPAIAETLDGRFVVLAKASADKVLIQDPLAKGPQTLSQQEFTELWSGSLLLLTRRAHMAGDSRKFDLTWFIPAVVRYRHLFRDVLIASFFLQLFALATPLFFQVVIDKVLIHRGLTTLDVLVIGFVAVVLFEALLGGLRTWIFSHTTNRMDVELGAKLFRHVLGLPLAYYQNRRVGETVARVRELDSIREFITGSALTLCIDLFFALVFLAIMYYYSPLLTWIVIGSIPCYILLAIFITPLFRKKLDDKFKRGAENQSFLVETVTGIETVKSLAVEPQFRNRWDEQLAGYVNAGFQASQLGNISSQAAQIINKITSALTLYFGAHAVIDGDMTVGQLVAFNMLSGRIAGPILKLVQLWQDFQQAKISIDRLGDVLNIPAEPGYNPNRAVPKQLDGRMTLDRVTFRYTPEGPEILRNLSLDIPAGQMVGVVGPSGSGKSTLTKLIQRLYVPESGRVMVDGGDLALVDPSWLRRQIGVVLQENYLFNRSIRDNIALADPAASMDQVIAAAKLAGAHDFIMEQSEGYDSKVGERGSGLSGGQRQRIAFARALLTNPRILILDEATSALDYESERAIQDNMARIRKGRTVLVIAHRLSTVREADRILTLEAGEIVEDGSHETLLRQNGRYAKLHAIQAGEVRSLGQGLKHAGTQRTPQRKPSPEAAPKPTPATMSPRPATPPGPPRPATPPGAPRPATAPEAPRPATTPPRPENAGEKGASAQAQPKRSPTE